MGTKIKNGILQLGTETTTDGYQFLILNIGNWNMDSTASVSILHTLSATEWKTIKSITGMIRNDLDNAYYNILQDGGGGLSSDCYINFFNSTSITLDRTAGGIFDSTNFDSSPFNRGFLTIQYKPD
jgi:hypothetical protein